MTDRRRPSTLALLAAAGPLAISPTWLARQSREAFLCWDDEEDDEDLPYDLEDGVATLTIHGPLMQRSWWWQSYDSIEEDLCAALADTRVREVLLRIDSPGGVCAGCFEAVRRMRAAVEASGKRVTAFADELAASAAYAVACIADEVVLPEPAEVGSVGVVSSLVSWAEENRALGVDFRLFVSGEEKGDGCPNIPISDGAAAREQARVDELAAIFFCWVAERRRMSVEAVKALEAGCRSGLAAVAAGLADRVASLSALRAQLTTRAQAGRFALRFSTMQFTEKHAAAWASLAALFGTDDPDELTAAAKAAAVSAPKAEELAAELAALRAAKAAAEKAATEKAEAEERAALLATAQREGRLSKATLDDPEHQALVAGFSVAQLKTYCAKLPRVVPVEPLTPRAGAAPTTLTREQKRAAAAAGLSEEEFLAQLRRDAEQSAAKRSTEDDED